MMRMMRSKNKNKTRIMNRRRRRGRKIGTFAINRIQMEGSRATAAGHAQRLPPNIKAPMMNAFPPTPG